jgi:hypothetical protein
MSFVKRGDVEKIQVVPSADEALDNEETKKALKEAKEKVSKEDGNNSELNEKN